MDNMFKLPKRVPKWAWYTSAGLAAGGFILYLRRRGTATSAEEEGAVAAPSTASAMPGIVVVPSAPGESPSAVLDTAGVPALQETYLSTIGGLTDQTLSLIGIIGDLFQEQSDKTVELLTGGGSGSIGSTPQPGGTVTVPPPAVSTPTPAAPADPCAGMEKGGAAGNCHPAGAICRQMIGCGNNNNGHYCTWKFRFPDGRSNCYNHYSRGRNAGKCVGPFGCP